MANEERRAPAGAADGGLIYANRFEIGFNAVEFRFRFLDQHAPQPGPAVEVVTTPAGARQFAELLRRCLDAHETEAGVDLLSTGTTPVRPKPAE
jgi:hypothetical protein